MVLSSLLLKYLHLCQTNLSRFNILPYVELGYEVKNTLKFFHMDFFHRMNYLDLPAAKPFHVQVPAQIILKLDLKNIYLSGQLNPKFFLNGCLNLFR